MKRIAAFNRKQRTLLIALTLLIIGAILFSAFRDNIHAVIPGKVYRSAQLSPSAIKLLVHFKGIKTIVNLRGENLDKSWYRKEINVSKALNIKHYDIRLNSKKLPTHQQLEMLSHIIQTAPEPILIHCESGVDRSGLASAMALILLKNAPLKIAEQQFSWRYFVTSDKSIGKLVFARYHQWLKQHNENSTKSTFLTWVTSVAPVA